MNDSSNTPTNVIDFFSDLNHVEVKIMKPFQSLDNFIKTKQDNDDALRFWKSAFEAIEKVERNNFETINLENLNFSYQDYKERIFKNNSKFFIRFLRIFSPIAAFKPIPIYLNDLGIAVMLDLFHEKLSVTSSEPEISMSSESLNFIFKNTFGFDTLTVNGCFEELKRGGFSKMTRALAIENLNNIGIKVGFSIFLRIDLVFLFLKRLSSVNKKISNA